MFAKKILSLCLPALIFLAGSCVHPDAGRFESRIINNPVLSGFYPDPSITHGEDGYYMVHSTFGYFPGIPIFYSPDLVSWEQIGHVLHRPEQVQFEGLGLSNQATFAPTIEYHEGTYYVACTEVWGRGNYVVTAQDPAGPWSDPIFFPEVSGIDPSLFFDEDGKVYLVYNSEAPDNSPLYEGHRTIRMFELDLATGKVKGEEPVILVNGGVDLSQQPVWIEGPHLYKVNNWYYLSAAEGGTSVNHRQVIFRSKNIQGPYEPWENNPILTQMHLDPNRSRPITSTGHADLIQDLAGDWWAVFLACRPYEGNHYNTGRETFMAPVMWTDGWPVINPAQEEVQYQYRFHAALPQSDSVPALNGHLHWNDSFNSAELDLRWVQIRAPQREWFHIDQEAGVLQMELLPAENMLNSNPSFLGRRQQQLRDRMQVVLEFAPGSADEKAGLAILQNEKRFYYLCRSMDANRPVVQLYRSVPDSEGFSMELLAQDVLKGEGLGKLHLLIEADRDRYHFSYHVNDEAPRPLGAAMDARFLSTETAGGFVGCVYGLYGMLLNDAHSETLAYWHSASYEAWVD
ncbi:glycoside hydrolase family 43 protein [Geofilum rhodophaeum]|uniref:glycoside hydrolase family 43 protein n=1 Tax=Geofilum rhodophaeum TaxID=1965019 RepID=UPI0013146717|nr:glycoside hydrolase family 43 protein [Geofilum rhodophaeum]